MGHVLGVVVQLIHVCCQSKMFCCQISRDADDAVLFCVGFRHNKD